MQLIRFDAKTEEEISSTLLERKIEYTMVQNVESMYHPGDNEKEYPYFRVWYWYVSDLIT